MGKKAICSVDPRRWKYCGLLPVEQGLDFRHLKGLLKLIAEEFAQTEKIKIKPGYFPFTEPSAELFAKHPELGWIELGGSGIFRPELVKPLLGREIPVLAWGLGIDRLAMFKLGIKDIRELFTHNLDFIRNSNAPISITCIGAAFSFSSIDFSFSANCSFS